MSGHSKWSSIKHQKGAADAKRGVIFSQLAKGITVAAKNGTDPEMNFQLRIAIDRARANNMPKDNIERAIERAKGGAAESLEEIMFEAYGPGGTAWLIETATDNRNRTVGEIRAIFNKYDGKLAETGSVSYLFKKYGQIILDEVEVETAELSAIDAGAEDVEASNGRVIILTDPKELEAVRQALAKDELESNEVSFQYQPVSSVVITDQKLAEKVVKLLHLLEELDDVVRVSSNFDLPDNLLE